MQNVDSHALFAGLAAVFCLFLGGFALFNGRSTTNRLFAGYNFANGFWNIGDWLYLFDRGSGALEGWLRLTGIGGCFLAPFYIHFGLHVAGLAERPFSRLLIRAYWLAGAAFAVLHQTPFLHTTALTGYTDAGGYWSAPGPLYPIFIASVLVAPVLVLIPLPALLRTTHGLRHNQISYLIAASLLGFLAVGIFAASFFSFDWPWAYYGVQCLVGFVFAYVIFQHHLIQLSLALRRVALLGALYALVALLVVPAALWFRTLTTHQSSVDFPTWFTALLVCGGVLSLPPIIYSALVRRSSVFQDRASWQLTHELKTPLAAIQSALEMLSAELSQGPSLSRKASDYALMIERNSVRLQSFVEQLLKLGEADKGQSQEIRRPLNLKDVVEDVIDQFPGEAHRIQVKAAPDLTVSAFADGLKQILTNLIANAVKHAPGSPVVVSAEPKGEEVHVSVADRGKGIAKADLERIFEPFTRAGATSAGSGLGLSIARQWVQAHGGRIWAESEGEGKGTTVTFALPKT